MNDRAFRRRLHRAFLMASLAPAAACTGSQAGSGTPGDSGGSTDDGAQVRDSATTDAQSSSGDSATGDAAGPSGDASSDAADGSEPVVQGCAEDAAPPAIGFCNRTVWPPCGYDGGLLSSAECNVLCSPDGGGGASCSLMTNGGSLVVGCNCAVPGRRPAGLSHSPPRGRTAASFFAHAAWFEAASVVAFRRLGDELDAHGAPAPLVAKARRAVEEEERHTRATSRLATRFGARVVLPRLCPGRVRDLAAIALENAVEGCVHEAYAAMVAMRIASHAADDGVRRAFQVIAREEVGHAALAWEVAAWMEPRLDVETREAVQRARQGALAALRAQLDEEPSWELRRLVGMPDRRQARRMLEELERMFLSPELAAA
jgi:hypothetical protein